MNEQDIILKEKIEKREKFDTILAYILLVFLLGCIIFVLYLKFIRKEQNNQEEYVPNYISLNSISNSLNSSTLANRYMNDGATLNSTISNDVLVVNYTKDSVNININIPVVSNELVVNIDKENTDIITDVYKEIANIICVYYGNDEAICRNTLDNLNDSVTGIRTVTSGDTNIVYITITESISVNNKKIYNEITKVGINETDYVLNISNISISNINITTTSNGIKFNGLVERLTSDKSDVNVIIKIYDINDNLLEENKYEFNKNNVLNSSSTFEIEFLLNNKINLNNINKYSIEITK